MKTLGALATEFGTDKMPSRHGYTRHFSRILEPRRLEPLRVLELGVHNGASLQMWREYFPNGLITGIDSESRCAQYAGERISVEIGSQDDPEFLKGVVARYGPFDFILDDATHCGVDQKISFETLYLPVNPGGIYAIEDLQVSYMPGWGESFVQNVLKGKLDQVLFAGKSGWGDPRNHPEEARKFLDAMDDFERQTMSIEVFQGMVFFKKWPADEVYL